MTRAPSAKPDDLVPHFVYRYYDADGRLVYVGCTSNPRERARHHSNDTWWWNEVVTMRNLVFSSRAEALVRERLAIRTEMPRRNVRGRWYAFDTRRAWTSEDYLVFIDTLRRSAPTRSNTRLIGDASTELAARFGITPIQKQVSA